ncbi:hypothetical protein MBLNU13_g10873t2 [Cladosporium sp. NU13]
MGSRLNKAGGFKFISGSGLNRRAEENKPLVDLYLLSRVLPQAIHDDLTGEIHEYFVAELQDNYHNGAVLLKNKATSEDAGDDDTTQTRVMARKILKVVDAYFEDNPDALTDPKAHGHHVFFNAAIVLNATWEVQMDKPRVFAKYLFGDSVQRVTVNGSCLRKRGESPRSSYDTINKQSIEIRDLKSRLETKDNTRELLKLAEAEEKIVEQRKMYEGKLKGINMNNASLERKVDHYKGRAGHLEQKVRDLLQQQLEDLNAS